MGSSLFSADIHEFLACLGKHAVAKATQGFPDSCNEEPECPKMVFVEDTDELAQFDNRRSFVDRERKGFAFGGRGKSTHGSRAGWGGAKEATAPEWKEHASKQGNSGWGDGMQTSAGGWETNTQKESSSGWGDGMEASAGGWETNTQKDTISGWGDETKTIAGGWETNTQKESCSGWGDGMEASAGGWETNTQKDTNSGWGDGTKTSASGWETKVQKETNSGWRADPCSGWGGSVGQDENSGRGEERKVEPKKTTQKEATCDEWGSSIQKSSFSGWEVEKTVIAGGWGGETEFSHSGGKTRTHKENSSGWGEDFSGGCGKNTRQYQISGWDKDSPTEWGKETRQSENSGWGKGKQVESGKATQEDTDNGLRSATQKTFNSGWAEEKAVCKGGWGEEKAETAGGMSKEKENHFDGWENSECKGDTDTGWGSSTQENDNTGWIGGESGTHQGGNSGWGEGNEAVGDKWGKEKGGSHGGWGERTHKKDTSVGWGRNTQMKRNAGWGEENKSTVGRWGKDRRDASSGWGQSTWKKDTGRWGSTTQEGNTRCNQWEEGIQKENTRTGWQSNRQKDGNRGWGKGNAGHAGGWEKEKNALSDGWGKCASKDDAYNEWGSVTGWVEDNTGSADGCTVEKTIAQQKGTSKRDTFDEWESTTPKVGNGGWGEDSEALADGWGAGKSAGWSKGPPENGASIGGGKSTQKEGDAVWRQHIEVSVNGSGGEKITGWEKGRSERDACSEWGGTTSNPGSTGWGDDNGGFIDGWGRGKRAVCRKNTAKRDAPIGKGSTTRMEDHAGWEKVDDEVLADGWGEEKTENSTQKANVSGWGEDNECTANGWGVEGEKALGWEKNKSTIDACIGGESDSQRESGVSWGEEKENSTINRWQSSSQKGGEVGWGKESKDTAERWGKKNEFSSDDRVDCAQNKDVHIGQENNTRDEGNMGGEDGQDGGWGQRLQQEVHDGWGEKESALGSGKESEVRHCGWEQNTQEVANSGWGALKSEPKSKPGNKDAPSDSGWDPPFKRGWGGEQKGANNDENGWGSGWGGEQKGANNDDSGWGSGWGHTPKSDTWKMASADSADGWGQRPKHTRHKEWSDSTEGCRDEKRRSGTFGPSGTNAVPLGKRRSFCKARNGDAEKGHGQSDEPCKSNGKPEALADSNEGVSEMPDAKHLKTDGWNELKSDEDATPRPNKRLNQNSGANSWASASLNGQNRRPRLKALINLPECSELNRLYKATNKILHYNGYQSGDKLSPEDETFILEEVLVHHRERDSKLGCGVDHVMIDSHADHQVNCFWVVRKDGSKTDFSYWKCLENLFDLNYAHVVPKEVSGEASKGFWGGAPRSAAPIKRQVPQGGEGKDLKEDGNDGW